MTLTGFDTDTLAVPATPLRRRVALPTQRRNTAPATLVVADAGDIAAEGLRSVLSDDADVQVVGHERTLEGTYELLSRLHPDLLILDPAIEPDRALAAVEMWQTEQPQLHVVLFINRPTVALLRDAFAVQASGLLLKGSPVDTIRQALHTVCKGRSFVDDALTPMLGELTRDRFTTVPGEGLSLAELRVLEQLVRGLSNRDIAAALCISNHTVKSHVSHLLPKLNCLRRTQLVARAFDSGLIS